MTNQNPKNTDALSASSEEGPQQASSRGNCYGLLALILRGPPTVQVVGQLRSGPLADALSDLGCDLTNDLAGELEAVTERLTEEYTLSFLGPGPHVSPYASVHHDAEGQLWGDSTVQVKRFVEGVGLSFEGNWDSIPDHIAIELELMQRLSAYEAELWARRAVATGPPQKDIDEQLSRCLAVEEKFLLEHLCVWVPKFCERLVATSTSLFYREMAGVTKAIVLSHVEQIAAVRNYLQPHLPVQSPQER